MSSPTIIIVGAGIVGSALAHFISSSLTSSPQSPVRRSSSNRKNQTKYDNDNEKKPRIIVIDHSLDPMQGSTAHTPGYIGQFNESPVLTRLAIDSVTEYAKIPDGYEVLGGIECAKTPEGVARLKSRCTAATGLGLPASIITAAQAAGLAPDLLSLEDVDVALYTATDGAANAAAITLFYQNEARRRGVEFQEGVVTGVEYEASGGDIDSGKVVGLEVEQSVDMDFYGGEDGDNREVDGGAGNDHNTTTMKTKMKAFVQADTVILATGIWTRDLCKDLDVPVPILPVAHPYMYVKHDRVEDDQDDDDSIRSTTSSSKSTAGYLSPQRRMNNRISPWVHWPEHRVYARDHGPFYGVGTYNHGPAIHCEPQDHVAIGPWIDKVFNTALEKAQKLAPILNTEDAVVTMPETKFNGICAITPDNLPIAGRVKSRKGLYLCAAAWTTHAAGVAKFVAGLVLDDDEDNDDGDGDDDDNNQEEKLDGIVRMVNPDNEIRLALDPGRFMGESMEILNEKCLTAYSDIYHVG